MDGQKVLATVRIKLVGDDIYKEARLIALKESKETRVKLRNTNSEEYKSFFTDLDITDQEGYINGIINSEASTFNEEAAIMVKEKDVPELEENATLEDQEKYFDALDKQRMDRLKRMGEYVEQRLNERKEALKIKDTEELKRMYQDAIIDSECSRVFGTTFKEYCIYRSVFEDEDYKIPAFSSFEDFKNSAYSLKLQITQFYNSLEVSGEDLKN